jgi:hypothetical protein
MEVDVGRLICWGFEVGGDVAFPIVNLLGKSD